MLSSLINAITAPSETFQKITNDYNWKQAMTPMLLIMFLAIVSSMILSEQIADLQWDQIQQSINNNPNISEEQKQEILGSQKDRIYSNSGATAIFIYVSSAISWPMRMAFWSLFSMLFANLFLGSKSQFGKVFTVVSFSYLPSVIEYLVKTPIQYISDNMMIFTGLGALGIGEQGDFINNFLSGIDIFAMWRVYLTTVGFTFLYNSKQNDTLRVLGALWIASLLIFSAIGAFFAGLAG
ncbi:MAG: YIP1 family protein [Candidatus Neomarinimicrobiota bacterium]|nr:YIP1 family protein [Candidatus Neomarinimicrobiota bacterium]